MWFGWVWERLENVRSLSMIVVCSLDALTPWPLRDTSWKYFISCCMPARSKWTRPSCSFVWDKSQCHRLSLFPKPVEKNAVRATLFSFENAIQNVTIFELSCFNYVWNCFGTFLGFRKNRPVANKVFHNAGNTHVPTRSMRSSVLTNSFSNSFYAVFGVHQWLPDINCAQ